MPTQVIFLVDLDYLVPLLRPSSDSESDSPPDLTTLFERVHRLILRILCSFVSFQDVHLDRVESPQFDVKTFSSTGFFPPLWSGRWGFREFREEHLDSMMNELSSHFEQIAETWFWPNSPQPSQYRKHLTNEKRKCNAHQWFQALEEIALLYEWDRPDLESPVKKFNESQMGPKPAANLVYVLSKLPHDSSEMGQFFGSSRDQWSSREIFQQLFDRKSAKTLTNVFKGDADVRVNIVDTGCLFEPRNGPPLYLEAFQKALKTFKGQVIDFRRSLKSENIPCALNAWFLPQTEVFSKTIDAIASQDKQHETQTSLLVKALDQNFRSVALPIAESSSANTRSAKRKWAKSPMKKNKLIHRLERTKSSTSETRSVSSRGASLMRLGSQTFEKRRRSNNDADGEDPNDQPPASKRSSLLTLVEKEADRERVKLEAMLKPYHSQSIESCLKMLWECQVQALKRGDSDGMLVALAELTVSSLMSCLKNNNSHGNDGDEPLQSIEDVIKLNFLVGPIQVGQRKTSQTSDGRIRDHKLQALYRVELHRWSVNSKDVLEEEILIHLRQISIWESPSVMFQFLTECLTPTYLRDQPDLLCQIYDELNIERHESLPQLFSPSKRHCLSIAPVKEPESSTMFPTMGANSDASINGLDEKLMKMTSRNQLEKLNKRFENTRRQINLESKRSSLPRTNTSKGAPKDVAKLARIQPTRAASFPSSEKEVTSQKLRAKRNLCFESDSPPVPSTSNQSTASISLVGKKSPRKKIISTPRKKASLSIHHHKKRSRSATLSKLMTPRKRHQILAPETPSGKVKRRRKTDGVLSIKESPNVEAYKQRSVMTPRRTQASLELRSKASFYAGKVSRNLMKATEKVAQTKFEASGLVYRSHGKSATRGEPRTPPSSDQVSKDRRSSWETFFPHLVKFSRPEGPAFAGDSPIKRLTPAQSATFNTPTKGREQTPRKSDSSRKVAFNMTPQAPTPKSIGKSNPKGILKTPHKEEERVGPSKMLFFDTGTPYKMPVDVNKTPLKIRNEIEVRKSPRQLLRLHREGLHSLSPSSFHTPEKKKEHAIPHTITSLENIENEKDTHNSVPTLGYQENPRREPLPVIPPILDGVKSQVLFYSPTKPTKASFKEYESGPTTTIPLPSTQPEKEFPEDSEISNVELTSSLSNMAKEKPKRVSRSRIFRQLSKSSSSSFSENDSSTIGDFTEEEIVPTNESVEAANCQESVGKTDNVIKECSAGLISKDHRQLHITIPLVRLSKEELLESYYQRSEELDNAPLRKSGSVTVTSPIKVDLVKDITKKSCDRRQTRRRRKALTFSAESSPAISQNSHDRVIPASVSSNEQSSFTLSERYPSTCSSIGDEDIPDEIPKLVVSPSLLNDSLTKSDASANETPPDLRKVRGLPKPFKNDASTGAKNAGNSEQLPHSRDEEDVDSSRRPSRRRVSVNRFGIDDITLEEVFSSPSRKKPLSNATPSKSGQKRIEPMTPSDKASPFGKNVEVVATPSPKRVKKRLKSMSSIPKPSCASRVPVCWKFDADTELIQDIANLGGNLSTATSFSPIRGEMCSTTDCPAPPKSPGKFWSVANITQSPRGEIKMKIQRTKKLQTNFVQRLSRSATMELGVSPGKLTKMIYQNSPSPKPKISNIELAVTPDKLSDKDGPSSHSFVTPRSFSQGSSKSSVAGFSPLSSMGLFDLTKSPLVMGGKASCGSGLNVREKIPVPRNRSSSRKVSKKLYNELL